MIFYKVEHNYSQFKSKLQLICLMLLGTFALNIFFMTCPVITAAETVRFIGHIEYDDPTMVSSENIPLPSVKIEVWDQDDVTDNDYLGSGFVDANGNFDIVIDKTIVENADALNQPDITFKIHAQSHVGSVHERSVGYTHNPDPYAVDATFDDGSLAVWDNWNVSGLFNAGSLVASEIYIRAPIWLILDEMYKSWRIADAVDGGGTNPNPLKVLHNPNDLGSESIIGYSSFETLLLWDVDSLYRKDTRFGVRHEYGHYILDKYSYYTFISKPEHDWRIPLPDTLENRQFSWAEGWASFYAAAIINNPIRQDRGIAYENDWTLERTLMGPAGPASEAAVAGLLWDLLDGPSDDSAIGAPTPDEDGDGTDYTFQQIFDIVTDENYFNSYSNNTVDNFALAWAEAFGFQESDANVFALHGINYVAVPVSDPDPSEPNNSYLQASILGKIVGEYYAYDLNISPGDVDYYKFELVATGTQNDFVEILIQNDAYSGSGVYDLNIAIGKLNNSGNLVPAKGRWYDSSSLTDTRTENISLEGYGPGEYYAIVFGATGYDLGEINPDFIGTQESGYILNMHGPQVVTELSVTPDSQAVNSNVGTAAFIVDNTSIGTMSWTASVTSGGSWLTITSGSSGTNTGTINVEFSANDTGSSRTGTIRVTASEANGTPKDVTVIQSIPDVSPPTAILTISDLTTEGVTKHRLNIRYEDDDGIDLSFFNKDHVRILGPNFNLLRGNPYYRSYITHTRTWIDTSYDLQVPGGAWTSVNNGTYHVWIEPNQIRDDDGHYMPAQELGTFIVAISPDAEELSVTPYSQSVNANNGTISFSVENTGTGTMPWTASVVSGGSWLSIASGSSGTNSGTISATFSANTTISSRTGTIRVASSGTGGSPRNVTVTQPSSDTSSSIVGWGHDAFGQVSNIPSGTGFIAIAAGGWHSLALKSDSSIVGWGSNSDGQVSNTPSGNDFVAIASGRRHSLALKSDGSIVGWGSNSDGQVSNTPSGIGFIAIAGGAYHNLALKSDGSIVSWGGNYLGVVNDTPSGNDFIAITASSATSLALKSDGSIVGWGADDEGQLSNIPSGNNFIAISIGFDAGLALKSDGSIVSWGGDDYGQLSNIPSGNDFIAIASGGTHSLSLRTNGSIVSWGRNYLGVVNDTPSGNELIAITGGEYHSLALIGTFSSVPDVIGLSHVNAESAITSAGLTIGTVTSAHSDIVSVGNVTSQSPVSGRSVATGSVVHIVVSLGENNDTDNDGCPDNPDKTSAGICGCGVADTDSDSDGTPDCNDGDDDNDGMADDWEVKYDLNPLVKDALDDVDGDGYSNIEEYRGRSNPKDANSMPKPNSMPWIPLLLLGG